MSRALLAFLLVAILPDARLVAAEAADEWDSKLFRYDKPNPFIVEVSTPTPEQLGWIVRPPQMAETLPDPIKSDGPEVPRTSGPFDILHLKFRDVDGEVVPVLLCTPKGKKGPFPVVIGVHGLTSNKSQVVAQIGPSLARRNFAIIAPDVPRHGERPGMPWSLLDASRPLKSFELFRQAIRDVRQCIDIAETRPELDTKQGVILVGYSLESRVSAVVGPADDRVKAMVLMVGGAHDTKPAAVQLPQLRSTDPRNAIALFAPRPLLLLNAKYDSIVTPDMAKRLYSADPKEQRWYECGHLLTNNAYEDAAQWVDKETKSDHSDKTPTRKVD